MNDVEESEDIMNQPYACLACSDKFTIGECRTKPFEGRPAKVFDNGLPCLYCPKCGSSDIAPADGEQHELESYAGKVGALN